MEESAPYPRAVEQWDEKKVYLFRFQKTLTSASKDGDGCIKLPERARQHSLPRLMPKIHASQQLPDKRTPPFQISAPAECLLHTKVGSIEPPICERFSFHDSFHDETLRFRSLGRRCPLAARRSLRHPRVHERVRLANQSTRMGFAKKGYISDVTALEVVQSPWGPSYCLAGAVARLKYFIRLCTSPPRSFHSLSPIHAARNHRLQPLGRFCPKDNILSRKNGAYRRNPPKKVGLQAFQQNRRLDCRFTTF